MRDLLALTDTVPAGQDFYQAAICADGKNYRVVETRERYSLASIATFEFWGQYETLGYLGTTGLIAKTIFNVSAGIGTRISGGVKMNTITASSALDSWCHRDVVRQHPRAGKLLANR